ncbi:Uncharacterised protein [Mycobacterium tuberculosis]|nr:Uncharacterised protein [Mycobacterium tuberculosis]
MRISSLFKNCMSIVSCIKVSSVPMLFCSEYGIMGEGSIPLAFRERSIPFFPRRLCIIGTGISLNILIVLTPICSKSTLVFSPIPGILCIFNGAR